MLQIQQGLIDFHRGVRVRGFKISQGLASFGVVLLDLSDTYSVDSDVLEFLFDSLQDIDSDDGSYLRYLVSISPP